VIDALRAEWTKLRTLPSTAWLLVGAAGATIAVSAIVAAAWHVNQGSTADPTKLSLTGIDLGQAVIATLAVLAISEEYETGMIRTSLAVVPPRITLLTAKAANLAGLTVPVGLAAVAGCLLAGRLLLPDAGLNPAGLAIQATHNLRSLPIDPWAGLGVLAAWTAAALLVAGLLLKVRDA
jgi:ABC-2 type transport system permease protein